MQTSSKCQAVIKQNAQILYVSMKQHFFVIGTSEKVLQFIMSAKSICNKNFFMNKNAFWTLLLKV
jgi:hypothetical protein